MHCCVPTLLPEQSLDLSNLNDFLTVQCSSQHKYMRQLHSAEVLNFSLRNKRAVSEQIKVTVQGRSYVLGVLGSSGMPVHIMIHHTEQTLSSLILQSSFLSKPH